MIRRPCLICSALTTNPSRCDTHQREAQAARERARGSAAARGYGQAWRNARAAVLAQHRALYGDMCPGYQRAPHPSSDLTVDHITPKAAGGSDDSTNLAVLCRSCNASKGAR